MKAASRGAAVVMALGVVALAAVAVTAMLTTQSIWARQSEMEANHAQAQALIQAGVDWARAVLSDDRRMGEVDHLKEPWSLRLPPMPVDNGELAGYIEEQEGYFNINSIVAGGKTSLVQLDKFRRLLSILGLPDSLAYSLADWIDADDEPQENSGAEIEFYSSLGPPYATANRPLTDISELAMVRDFGEDVRVRLAPYVTALPYNAGINVNTAPAEVLAAVIDDLDLDSARALVAQRQRAYFRSVSDFSNRLPRESRAAAESTVRVSSRYFLARVRVTFGGAEASGLALLARSDVGWPAIVWRRFQ